MLVAVTGGTGFVGSHAVKAILDRGHEVRLLVRSPEKVDAAMRLQGIEPDEVEVAVADLRDATAIADGVDGCDAVVHAASVYTFDPTRWEEMAEVNLAGMEAVIEAGIASGLDPIVHVSSFVALLRDGEIEHGVGPDEPPGDAPYGYSASKAVQERAARRYQDDGHPVVIVHPGGVWGPRDPYLGESQQVAKSVEKGLLGMVPPGGLTLCDVRDVAQVLAAVLERGRGPRRYSAAGSYMPMTEIVKAASAAAGKQRRSFAIPDGAARAMQQGLATLNRRGAGRRLPATADAIWLGRHRPIPDNTKTQSDLDVMFGLRLRRSTTRSVGCRRSGASDSDTSTLRLGLCTPPMRTPRSTKPLRCCSWPSPCHGGGPRVSAPASHGSASVLASSAGGRFKSWVGAHAPRRWLT